MNKTEEDLSPAIYEIGEVLGIDFRLEEKPLPPELMKLIKKREELRGQKRWEEADRIREEMRKKGILLKDTPEGTEWIVKHNE
ncbi:MAG: hypothetical protein IBX41_09365 [Methanophagales archaeon]|nr:hypothetical protein [Methanophagales archaeon]